MFKWISDLESKNININTSWLGDGQTSKLIIEHIKEFLNTEQ